MKSDSFKHPPISELIMDVQFAKLDELTSFEISRIGSSFEGKYPKVQEVHPLEPTFEHFGPEQPRLPQIQIVNSFFTRLWFMNQVGDELLQIQRDRFIRNWRKIGDCDYPGYTKLRDEFESDFREFSQQVVSRLSTLVLPTQCELAYVDFFPFNDTFKGIFDLGRVIALFDSNKINAPDGELGDMNVNLGYILRDESSKPYARLKLSVDIAQAQGTEGIRFATSVRGTTSTADLPGVMSFFNRSHESIIRTFKSVTTPEMQEIWSK